MESPLDPTRDATEVGTATASNSQRRLARGREVDLAPGTVVGRYVIEAVIGSGGMGVVFRARDPALDRVVALKLLYPERVVAHGEARLLREARAMAQLSHPNVVSVYGVEHWQGGAVLAMELVEGRTLEQWLRTAYDAAEGLRLMLEAGEGLRAAHDAGLVHRDFKPSNVLVGEDGRARVVDFGLVRHEPLAESVIGSVPGEGSPSKPDELPPAGPELRTEAGRLMGTIAYMAPEQLMGLPADARSDQYAYCVSLWEVLCGRRPFHGHALASLDAKLEGPPPWPTELRTPPRIVAIVRRGLSVRPEQRWPSVAALLEQLHAGRRSRRALGRWIAPVVGLGLAVGLTWYEGAPSPRACTGAAGHLAGLWDDERRAAIRQALAEAGEIHDRDTWPRIERRLDAWTTAWIDTYTEACEATSVRGEATEAELDERMSCLRDAHTELHAVVGTLVDASAADRAVELAAALPDPQRCLDPRTAHARSPQLPDPELAAQVDALHQALVEVQTLSHAGRVEVAFARLEPLIEPAKALGWAPLWCETLMLRASIERERGELAAAERDYVEAHALATAAGLPVLAVRAAEQLIRVVGLLQARHAEGMTWADVALAMTRSEPAAADREVEVLESMAVLLHEQGKYAEAAEQQRRVLELRGDRAEPLKLATSLEALGNIVERMGRPDEAIELHRRALELRERELGPEHVTVATNLNNLAAAMMGTGEAAQALPLLERVLRIRERALGPDNVQLVSVLNNLGSALIAERDFATAELHLRRMLALLEANFPGGHPHMGSALLNLGKLYSSQGRIDEAREHYERSFAMWERTLGPAHPKLGLALDNLGNLELREGRPRVALEHYRRALALREAALGSDHPDVVVSLFHLGLTSLELADERSARAYAERARRSIGARAASEPELLGLVELLLGRVLLAEGRASQALVPLERARASGLTGADAAEVELALARALWEGSHDRARAQQLARRAHASFHAVDDELGARRAERWLADHPDASR